MAGQFINWSDVSEVVKIIISLAGLVAERLTSIYGKITRLRKTRHNAKGKLTKELTRRKNTEREADLQNQEKDVDTALQKPRYYIKDIPIQSNHNPPAKVFIEFPSINTTQLSGREITIKAKVSLTISDKPAKHPTGN